MKSPLLALASCFALGIVLARPAHPTLAYSVPAAEILLASASACLLVGLLLLRRGWQRASGLTALAGFLAAGALASQLFEFRFAPEHVRYLAESGADLADPVRLEGTLASAPLRAASSLQFDLEARRVESRGRVYAASGKIRLWLQLTEDPEALSRADSLRLQSGDSIRTLARLRRPRAYRNPGAFDFRRREESIEDLYWMGNIRSPLLIEKLPREGPRTFSSVVRKIRLRLLEGIDRMYPPWSAEAPNGAVLKAVLVGERSALDAETIENFRKTGLYHLLVIAGLHVGLLAMLAEMFLRRLGLRESWRCVALLALLGTYGLIVEQRAPTLRATLMIAVYLLARFLYREHAPLNAVGLAGLVLLLHRPAWLFESGFELSFSAALLIAALAVPILERTTEPYRHALVEIDDNDRDTVLLPQQAQFRLDVRSLIATFKARWPFFNRRPALASRAVTVPVRFGVWAANAVLFSAILQLGLVLPMAATFHRVSFAGAGLNALAIPVMVLLLALAMPTVLVAASVPQLASWPAKAVALVLKGLFALTDLPGLPHWLSYRVADPPPWVAWGFVISVFITALALGRNSRVFWGAFAAFGVFVALVSLRPFAAQLGSGALEVTALDCGELEALLIVLPHRTTLLVTGGASRPRVPYRAALERSRWSPGEDVVSPYLWWRGIDGIDLLVLTRSPGSRQSVVPAVVRNFRIGEIWHGGKALDSFDPALLEELTRRRIPLREVAAGDRRAWGATSISVLWPPSRATDTPPRAGDQPLTVTVSSGELSVLVAGGFGAGGEPDLDRLDVPLASQVLEVARSRARPALSPEFLRRVSPRVAVVSGEGDDEPDWPAPDAPGLLRAPRTQVFRTAVDGAVTVEMRAGSLAVHTYRASMVD